MKDYEGAIALTEAYRRTDSTNVEVNRQNALAYCLRKEYPTAIKTLSGSDRPGRQHTADMLLPGSQLLRNERIL